MTKREKHYYTFYYVDGSKQEFERNGDDLSTAVLNEELERIEIDNTFIIMENVIKVKMETQSDRAEEQKQTEKSNKETLDALSNFKF